MEAAAAPTMDYPGPRPEYEGPDEIGVVRWRAGILPSMKEALGLADLEVGDLPDRFPFLVNHTTGSVIQPVFDFLAGRAVVKGLRTRQTLDAYAYDLRSWFETLAIDQIAWNEAGQECFDEFVWDMASEQLADPESADVSDDRQPPEPLTRATIKRRAAAIGAFYKHALGHEPFNRGLVLAVGRVADQSVRPIPVEDLGAFFASLGPQPSDWTGIASSRLWLCCLVAVVTGMRRMEVCGLDVEHFDAFPAPCDPQAEYAIIVKDTKGGQPRPVLMPGWVVNTVRTYVAGERAAQPGVEGPFAGPLFLNHRTARGAPLQRLRPATLSSDLRRAVLAGRMMRKNPLHRYGTGSSERPHTFHDLRHTCACLLYASYRNSSDPWVEVQNRLGHRLLRTTTDIYLRHVEEFADPGRDLRQTLTEGMLFA